MSMKVKFSYNVILLFCYANEMNLIKGLMWSLRFGQVCPRGVFVYLAYLKLPTWDRLSESSLHGSHRKSRVPKYNEMQKQIIKLNRKILN